MNTARSKSFIVSQDFFFRGGGGGFDCYGKDNREGIPISAHSSTVYSTLFFSSSPYAAYDSSSTKDETIPLGFGLVIRRTEKKKINCQLYGKRKEKKVCLIK